MDLYSSGTPLEFGKFGLKNMKYDLEKWNSYIHIMLLHVSTVCQCVEISAVHFFIIILRMVILAPESVLNFRSVGTLPDGQCFGRSFRQLMKKDEFFIKNRLPFESSFHQFTFVSGHKLPQSPIVQVIIVWGRIVGTSIFWVRIFPGKNCSSENCPSKIFLRISHPEKVVSRQIVWGYCLVIIISGRHNISLLLY